MFRTFEPLFRSPIHKNSSKFQYGRNLIRRLPIGECHLLRNKIFLVDDRSRRYITLFDRNNPTSCKFYIQHTHTHTCKTQSIGKFNYSRFTTHYFRYSEKLLKFYVFFFSSVPIFRFAVSFNRHINLEHHLPPIGKKLSICKFIFNHGRCQQGEKRQLQFLIYELGWILRGS